MVCAGLNIDRRSGYVGNMAEWPAIACVVIVRAGNYLAKH